MGTAMKTISIVIPCCNEEAVLPELFRRVSRVLDQIGHPWEVICVDDGSRDRTWELLSAHVAVNPRWKALRLSRNFGHQTAVSAGLYHCSGDAVCILDADLQDPPEQLSRLVDKWKEGYEVVYGVRVARKDQALKRLLAWGFYRVIARLVSHNIPPDAGDFCLMDRKVVEVMNALPERNKYLRGLRTWCGFRQVGLEFERHARAAGTSNYSFRKSLRLALDGIYSFSVVPLGLASYFGLCIAGLSLLGMIIVAAQYIFRGFFARFGMEPAGGFAAVVLSIFFLGGVQLICLGILGEYLGRIYDETKARPHWIISEAAGLPLKPLRI
jgi:dolichol-phosphate mannosyltransferase